MSQKSINRCQQYTLISCASYHQEEKGYGRKFMPIISTTAMLFYHTNTSLIFLFFVNARIVKKWNTANYSMISYRHGFTTTFYLKMTKEKNMKKIIIWRIWKPVQYSWLWFQPWLGTSREKYSCGNYGQNYRYNTFKITIFTT